MLHPSVRSLPGLRLVLLLALFLVAPAGAAAAGLGAGATHACAAKTDGTVWCWGSNDSGELGSPGDEAATPRQVVGLTGATAVTTGSAHTCALLTDRTVKCWGQNVDGQIGDGTGPGTPFRPVPTTVSGLTGVTAISAGAFHTCALKHNGTVACWGFNVAGQLGNDTTANAPAPVAVSGLTEVAAISAGAAHTCAIVHGGGVRCWGNNSGGQLGAATPSSTAKLPVAVAGVTGADSLTAGSGHTCMINTARQPVCWGSNGNGQLGDGSKTSRNAPAVVPGLANARNVSAGGTHTCAALADGTVHCWGAGTSGELGNGSTTDALTPTPVIGITSALAVSSGASFSCALLTTATASCWGDGYSGQTGNGFWAGTAAAKSATNVPGLSTVTTASSGVRTACAVAGGTLQCWGWGGDGNLGTGVAGPAAPSPVTVTIPGLPGGATIDDVGVGFGHTCVLTSVKTVYCWGLGQSGQLGNGTTADSSGPVQVSGLTDAEQLSVGTFSNCVVRTGGVLACWGANDSAQLGDGTQTDRSVPTLVDDADLGGPAIAVAAGNSHSCAVDSTGAVLCWGVGEEGQLGTGDDASLTPIVVPGVSGASQVGVGIAHTCALTGGAVKCWGDDSTGQLGDGPTDSSGGAVVTALASGGTQLSVGGYHACAVLTAGPGQVNCWGNNSLGQLGDGTLNDAEEWRPVNGLTDAVSIDLGFGSSCARTIGGALACWGDAYYGQAGDGATGGHFGLTGLAAPVAGLDSIILPPVKGPPAQPDPPKTDPPKGNPPVIVDPPAVPTLRLSGGKLSLKALLISPSKKSCPKRLTLTISVGKTKQSASVKTKKVTVAKKVKCSLTATIKLKPSKLKKAKSVRVKISGKGVKTLSKTVKAS